MKVKSIVSKSIALLALSLVCARGATYYVATSGSDSNAGTSSSPFRTISHAYSLAGAGTTILVAPGTYTDYQSGWGLHLGSSGTASSPIVLQSQVRGGAIIDGQNASDRNEAVYIDGSYNVVNGFEIKNGPNGGISIWGNGNKILNCEVDHNGNPASSSGNGHDGIYENEGTSGSSYIGNYIHDNGRSGGSNLDHGMYLCGNNDLVVNNVSIRNDSRGLQIAGYTTISNMKVYNNVFAYNGIDGIVVWQAMNGVDIRNNICYANGRYGIDFYAATGSGVTVDHNLVYGNASTSYNFTDGGSSVGYTLGTTISSDPQFANETSSGFDAHLKAGSPAIGAGYNFYSTITTDITGATRPSSGNWDFGAYAYASSGGGGSSDTTPPTVSITAPTGGATVSGSTVTFSANAADNVAVASVQFKLDGVNAGSAKTAPPYSMSWNSTAAANGSHSLTAMATDTSGHQATSTSVTVMVNNQTSQTLSLPTFPSTAGVISGPFVVANSAIAQPAYTSVTAGGQAVYTFNVVNAGSYTVSALVNCPGADNNSFFVNMDAQPTDPMMIWDVPLTTGFASQTVSWRGNGVASSTSSSGMTAQYSPIVFSLTAGTHQLIVRGREGSAQLGAITIAPYGQTVTPPTVSLTAPANGASYKAPAIVNLTASVTANGHTITAVQFYNGSTMLGQSATAPYTYAWNNVSAGSYTVSAKAVYDTGSTVTSSTASVTVTNPAVVSSSLTFAATSGTISTPFVITNGNAIVEPTYTGVTAGGQAVYAFNIAVAGNYTVAALVKCPTTDNNSFFVNVDAQPTDPTMVWDIPVTTGLVSQTVSWRGNGVTSSTSSSGLTAQYSPKVFKLSAGTHQLIVRGREGLTQLGTITVAPTALPAN